MSQEIDSTTTSHSEGNEAPLFGFFTAINRNIHEPVSGNHSTNNQKRKLIEDEGISNPESVDDSKKQRTNDCDHNNAIASVGDSAQRTNGDNVNRNGGEATSAQPEEACAGITIKQEIKEEPHDDNEAEPTSSPSEFCDVKLEVKTEASDESESPPAEEATSSIRDSCQYGIKCYRDEDTTSPTPSKKQWTSKDIDIMLKMVKERPVIWQVDYSDRTSRPNAFLEIEKVVGFPALEVKRKLHNMRCTFRNQYKIAQFQNKPVKWKFYDAMKFMYSSALNESADHWDDDLPTKSSEQNKVIVPWKKRIREPHPKHNNGLKTPDPVALSNSSADEDKPISCNQDSRDDCSMFGDYVADSIRNLPEDLKELAKRQITHLLFDITAHTDARQNNSSIENGDALAIMDPSTNVLYTVTDPVYGNYPQTVLSETREIQLGLHEF